jgi:hypothetical protein
MIIKKIFLLATVFPVIFSGCENNSGPGPEIHDSKYVVVTADGGPTDPVPGTFECVLDQFTGLTWEVKSDRPGLHDWRNTYSWYDPDESSQGELDYRGTPMGGACSGSECDTHSWVEAVNTEGYCGHHDWRVASRDELASISDPRKKADPPTTNMNYFPYMQAGEYWSGNDYSFQWNAAWVWSFQHGHDRVEWKASPRMARLVRGQAMQLDRVKD